MMDHKMAVEAPSRTLDARARKTRAALCAALLALLGERALDQVTIREITGRAGVGYASFFRHYATKEALLDAVVEDEVATLLGLTMPAFVATDTYAAAHALCAYVSDHARLWSTLLTGGAAGSVRAAFVRQAGAIETDVPPSAWLPPELAIIHGVSAMAEILAWWLPRRADYPVAAAATILDRLVIAPATRTDR